MGVREIDRFLEQWRMDARDLLRRLIMAPMPRERALRQAPEMARHMAAGPGVDRIGYGGGTGRGSPYHRPVGRRIRGGAAALIFEQSGGSPFRLRLTKELAPGTFSQTRACVLQTARLVCKTCVSILTGDQVLPGRNQSCLNIA